MIAPHSAGTLGSTADPSRPICSASRRCFSRRWRRGHLRTRVGAAALGFARRALDADNGRGWPQSARTADNPITQSTGRMLSISKPRRAVYRDGGSGRAGRATAASARQAAPTAARSVTTRRCRWSGGARHQGARRAAIAEIRESGSTRRERAAEIVIAAAIEDHAADVNRARSHPAGRGKAMRTESGERRLVSRAWSAGTSEASADTLRRAFAKVIAKSSRSRRRAAAGAACRADACYVTAR